MRLLVWQWGRFGAGPRLAVEYAASLGAEPGVQTVLSLSRQSETMRNGVSCDLPVDTYESLAGWARRLAFLPLAVPALARRLRALHLDGALCAMPAPLDLLMAAALRRAGVPFGVIVHDATVHPGDILPLQAVLQRQLLRRAAALVTLSTHVAVQLRKQPVARAKPMLTTALPAFAFGPTPKPPRAHSGPLRLLSFGRLLPYKGLDLLADAIALLDPALPIEIRIVGQGPETPLLDRLRAMPRVTVENRWVPEVDIAQLLAWSDAVILPYREASQSGVAAAAVTARRWIVSTRVGGLAEQLADEPLARLCDPSGPSLALAITSLIEAPPEDTNLGTRTKLGTADTLSQQLRAVFDPEFLTS